MEELNERGGMPRKIGLKFCIEGEILSRYPRVIIGVLVGRDVEVGDSDLALDDLGDLVIQEVRAAFESGPVTKHPFIASWRAMYRSFGTRPADYRPSAEALLRRVLRGKGLPRINTAVDAYNALSLRHLVPIGGFDLDRIEGTISLRFSRGGESFIPLGASGPEETYEGEPVYADEARVLTRRWNHRDCDHTKITEDTSNLALFVDGSEDIPKESVERAVGDLESLLSRCCLGEYSSAMADVRTPYVSL
jgi:DNA/RNA-binding domain of Phe-tRNA-synthetase-like protein